MVRVESLKIEGECFFQSKLDPGNLNFIKDLIKDFMNKRGYMETAQPIFSGYNFFTIDFLYEIPPFHETPLFMKVRKALGLINDTDFKTKKYYIGLERTRNDIPYELNFLIKPIKDLEKEGFLIKIVSQPAILFKIRQMGERFQTNSEFILSDIIDTNRDFIAKIIAGLGATTIRKPNPKIESIKTSTVERLENLGFVKSAKLFKDGRIKVYKGVDAIPDGITDLRSAWELFVQELVNKTGEKSEKQDKIKQNLDILKSKGYLKEPIVILLSANFNVWIYSYLSDKVHKKEGVGLTDAEFLFNIFERVADYLMDKVVYGI